MNTILNNFHLHIPVSMSNPTPLISKVKLLNWNWCLVVFFLDSVLYLIRFYVRVYMVEALESVMCDVIKIRLLSISGSFFSTSHLIPPF